MKNQALFSLKDKSKKLKCLLQFLFGTLRDNIMEFTFQYGICELITKAEARARVGRPQTSSSPPVILLLAVPRRLFYFGSLVLDVVFRYLSLC